MTQGQLTRRLSPRRHEQLGISIDLTHAQHVGFLDEVPKIGLIRPFLESLVDAGFGVIEVIHTHLFHEFRLYKTKKIS